METTVPRSWLPFSGALLLALPPAAGPFAAQDKVDFFVGMRRRPV